MMLRQMLCIVALGAPLIAMAQAVPQGAPRPNPQKPGDDEKPAVQVAPAPDEAGITTGSNIVGERESPIGLYITPWRDAYAEQDIGRPARLLQVDMSPIDRDVFARQVEYHKALTAAADAKTAPPAPPAKP